MRPVVTKEDVEAARSAGALEIDADAVITQAARELAERTGVTLRRATGPALAPLPASPGPAPQEPRDACVVTAVGRNRPFILSELTTRIAELKGNIQDISQRIVGGYFSTILVVDLERVETFGSFKAELEGLSRENDYKVIVQHERLFNAMHRL